MDGGGSRAAEGGREATRSALDANPDVPTLGGAGTANRPARDHALQDHPPVGEFRRRPTATHAALTTPPRPVHDQRPNAAPKTRDPADLVPLPMTFLTTPGTRLRCAPADLPSPSVS